MNPTQSRVVGPARQSPPDTAPGARSLLQRKGACEGTNQAGHALPFLDPIQRSFGCYEISDIRAHTDRGSAAEALRIGAEAFTRGSAVTFSRTPSLHTAAHEAAHVVQQRVGVAVPGGMGQEGDAYERHADEVADRVVRGQSSETLLGAVPGAAGLPRDGVQRSAAAHPQDAASAPAVVQRRRIPPNVQALLTNAGANGPNFAANAAGAQRLIDRAMAELSPADQTTVLATRRGALTALEFDALPLRERLSLHANAIRSLFPTLELGDPTLLDTGPRPLTADAANITTLVNNADTLFNDIASGARDAWLTDVFGAGSVAAAKVKYTAARTWMNALHAADKIVTDRSGYNAEVSLGGLTGFQEIIRVDPSTIDSPSDDSSVTTLLHESMHAGNNDVEDQYSGFDTATEAEKLTYASCFEVVPWRILDPANPSAFTGQVFIPAGTTVGGVTAPAQTRAELGAEAASERFRGAWTIGLNLHLAYVQLFRQPTDWTVPLPAFGGMRLDASLPWWSKLQKLTIHRKTTIDPASPEEAKHPVSQIDVALSEGVIRKLAAGMDLLSPLRTEPAILAFEAANSTAAERAAAFPGGAHTSATAERDFLLNLAVRDPSVKPIAGNVLRDLGVVRRMGDPSLSLMSDIFKPRDPATLPFSD